VDPQPGAVSLDGGCRPSRAWTHLVSAEIAAIARRAERPALGEVSPNAEAVLFAHRSGMLACVAAEWCAGRLASRWWSHALLRDAGDPRAVVRAWLDAPAYIVAAVDELAQRHLATAFVERLNHDDIRALAGAIVVHHGLKWLM